MNKPQLTLLRIPVSEKPLSKEQKAFNSRMQQIEKLRARFSAWERAELDYERAYSAELLPLLEAANGLRVALVHRLDCAMEHKGLTKRERALLKELLLDLADMLLAERDDEALKAIYNKHAELDYDSEEANETADMKAVLESMFGIDLGDTGELDTPEELAQRVQAHFAQEAQRHEEVRQAQEKTHTKHKKKTSKQQERSARIEAEAKEIDLSVRSIYRKLVSALHPDREADPLERERKTELMQQINRAYDKRDLLRLLELQLELEHIGRDDIAGLGDERLRHYNAVLKEQIDELKRDLLHVEVAFRDRFGLPPFMPVRPETVLRDLKDEVQEAKRQNHDIEMDLEALSDAKRTKSWLKEIRRRPVDDDFDYPF